MKRSGHYGIAAALILLAAVAVAQMGPGRGRMGGPLYDTATEMTVSGTVSAVEEITAQSTGSTNGTSMRCPRGWSGTHLRLNTDSGTVTVHVGPSSFLASKNFKIAKDDKLTIVGSKVQYQNSDFLIAKQITKGNEVVVLRDAVGFPLWGGSRRGAMTPAPGK